MAITKEASKEEIKEAQVEQKAKARSEIEQAPAYDVKQVIRGINYFGVFGEDGSYPVAVIDAYLTEYLNRGYRLLSTHYLGAATVMGGSVPQEVAAKVLYVLVKEG